MHRAGAVAGIFVRTAPRYPAHCVFGHLSLLLCYADHL